MCGIAGFFALLPRPLAPRGVLERMVEAVRHRGPDDGGVYLDDRAGLGHRRLSIVDLSGGRQPLSTADEKLWVTFNGEIFNYVELTKELTARGRVFRTRCDTETILHAYAEYGPDGVQSLNGDFAYALWDRSRKRLVMARDRMGVRPLYYTVHQGVLVFASELKSLFLYPGLRAELDPLGLDQCFTFWSALAKQHNEALRTFSLEFESPELDESAYQRTLVDALSTDHSSLRCKGGDISASFEQVIRHTERPVLRSAPAALYLLSRQVRDHGFKVVLTGEGADEVFGGYDIFKEAMVRRFWARQPDSKWRPLLLRRLYPYLGGLQSQPTKYLEAFFRQGLGASGDPLFSHLPRFALTRRISQFYSGDLRRTINGYDPLEDLRSTLPPQFASWHPLSRAQYLETGCLLPGYILSSQGDRVAMAHGVEGRFPFLDHRVVELGAALAPAMKLKGLREKYVLRQRLGRHLPSSIVERPKQPYRAPDSESFLHAGPPQYVEELR